MASCTQSRFDSHCFLGGGKIGVGVVLRSLVSAAPYMQVFFFCTLPPCNYDVNTLVSARIGFFPSPPGRFGNATLTNSAMLPGNSAQKSY